MANKYHQGLYKPRNPQKYKGDASRICFRSSWEHRVMQRLDMHPDVVQWASEEPWFCIPYRHPFKKTVYRYFPDFWVKKKLPDGSFEITVIEIKPYKEVQPPPIKTGKQAQTKSYAYAVMTWAINQAKWEAADKYCRAKGWKFQKITERDIGD